MSMGSPMYGMPQAAPPAMPYAPVTPAVPAAPLTLPQAKPDTPRRSSSNVALYVALGVLFLIALFLVVFFALRA